jgi:hypothetical protein
MMLGTSRSRRICVAIVAVALGIMAQGPAPAQNNGKQQDGQGKYAELTAEWWQWVYRQPVSTNPLFDTTGASAANGQPDGSGPAGKVFFLAGVVNVSGTVERTITVPAGKDLFFPVINSQTDNVGYPPKTYSVPELRAIAAANVDGATYHATLDGTSLDDQIVRVKSPTFSYVLPDEDNIYHFFGLDVTGEIKPAVTDGYWLYIPALPSGQHELKFNGALPVAGFSLNITYHITVP